MRTRMIICHDNFRLSSVSSRQPIPLSLTRRRFDQKRSSLEFRSVTLLSGSTARTNNLAISKSRPKRNHLAGSAIPQAISRHILSHPQKRMAAKDKKGTTSGTESDRPSIEDLGKIFDEMTQERLGRRDPITRRWRRKTWAPPIWAIKSGNYNIQVGLPAEFVLYTLIDSSETDAQSFHL
ncbi:hypothetical protein LB506_012622 [Fusarium annulatum]|nr:hypothetical protein LB506_012622 [Fusarium annulatum]